MRSFFAIVFVGMTCCTNAQNLVPNPSFEEFIQCPEAINDFDGYVKHWFKASNGSSDYFNACAFSNADVGVPHNFKGFQYPHTGNAYTGIICYGDGGSREYLEVKLTNSLMADTIYCIEFLVVRSNVHTAATSSLGLYFSSDTVFGFTAFNLNYSPQITNDSTFFIVDTLNWTKISGEYKASGGEEFITIGNFYPNSLTPVVGNTLPLPQNAAYYYIDDVSVMKCSQWNSVIELVENEKRLNVYPNPANEVVTVDFDLNNSAHYRVQLTDLVGRVVSDEVLNSNARIVSVSSLVNGVYILHLMQDNKPVANTKLVVLR